MKKTIFTLLLSLSCCWLAAQCPTNILFTRQGQIDSFQINYPGCSDIPGLVGILDFPFLGDTIFNLNGLSSLTSIGGYLEIIGCEYLNSLSGLDNLVSIGGYLSIQTESLADLSALGNLKFIGGNLDLLFSQSLKHLNGLNQLDSLHGRLRISGNGLLSLDGLHNLSFIGGDLWMPSNSMTKLDGLDSLKYVGGNVELFGNNFFNLNELDNLTAIGGSLQIEENDSLTDLSGLDHLATIGGYLSVVGNTLLLDLNGFNSLKSVGGELGIGYNDSLTTVSGFGSLDTVGCLNISNNPQLISLNGLQHLSKIGACDLDIGFNYGGLIITENYSLPDLVGLDNVTSVAGCLIIENNVNLSGLNGLGNLKYIGGCDLGSGSIGSSIKYNYSLTSLEGLNKLESISRLEISENDFLASLQGLDSLKTTLSGLTIKDNVNLFTCSTPSICAYLESGGIAYISDNTPGCNSVSEIEAACTVSIEETSGGEPAIVFSPNPAGDFLQIQISDPEKWEISLFDLQGRQMFQQNVSGSQIIEVKDWSSGIYALRAVSGGRIFSGKIVKQ